MIGDEEDDLNHSKLLIGFDKLNLAIKYCNYKQGMKLLFYISEDHAEYHPNIKSKYVLKRLFP